MVGIGKGTDIMIITDIINHPRFVGLWTYKPYGAKRKFCASVMANGAVTETRMYINWEQALIDATEIIDEQPS